MYFFVEGIVNTENTQSILTKTVTKDLPVCPEVHPNSLVFTAVWTTPA